jgi:hypothetical protein
MTIPNRFPKIGSLYNRESKDDSSKSYVTPEVNSEYLPWLRDNQIIVAEKLHGTNAAIRMEHGDVIESAVRHGNREMNRLNPFGSESHRSITRGIQNSIEESFLYQFENGWVFGEVVGPNFNSNPYNLDRHLFIPFDWLREHCYYDDFPNNLDFHNVREWMRTDIYSKFKSRIEGLKPEDASIKNGHFVEGVIIINADLTGSIRPNNIQTKKTSKYKSIATNMCKLRRDMFEDISVENQFPEADI